MHDLPPVTVPPGARLGPYEILTLLGRGGMGEVYRARDTRLERTVAVKILRDRQPNVQARFAREAKAIATLVHPHICTPYDIGREADTDYLVMECLEGETLAARLQRGALPLDQALRIAIEIGSALDNAHRAGIVHRDLKPSNVMLTGAGAKLLDFGLAKVHALPQSAGMAATATDTLSGDGRLTGTVPYMAPEQLEGRGADARSDLFAFGAVLYEMVTGRRAFEGESQASVIAAILEHDPPPVSTLQRLTPPTLDRIIKRSLAKNPDARWQTARDLVEELKWTVEVAASADVPAGGRQRRRMSSATTIGVATAGLVLVAVAVVVVAGLVSVGSPPRTQRASRFELAPPEGTAFGMSPLSPGLAANGETTAFALSPDGSQLAFVATAPSGHAAIWLRSMSELTARVVPGTDEPGSLFWSPDNRSIAFVAGGKLKRLDLAGSSAVPLCDVSDGHGVSGTPGTCGNGAILFAPRGGRILRVSTAGGPPTTELEPDASIGEISVGWPWFLPDGRRSLYLAKLRSGEGRVMLRDPGKPPVMVLSALSNAQFAGPDYVVFAREGTLIGQHLDLASGRAVGQPFALAHSVQYNRGTARSSFSVSQSGTLVYQGHKDLAALVWFDRSGRELGPVGSAGDYLSMRISPEGQRAIFARWDAQAGNYVGWKLDFARAVETRLSSERRQEQGGVWLPNGTGVFFSITDGGAPHVIYRDLPTGAEKPVLPAARFISGAQDVSPDGRLAFFQLRPGGTDIWTVPVDGSRAPSLLVTKGYDARFSPDGRLVSFIEKDDSNVDDVYVAAASASADRFRVSKGGGDTPRWSADGRDLVYRSADRHIVSVAVRVDPSTGIELGPPVQHFAIKGKWSWRDFDLSPDGKFLAIVPQLTAAEQPFTVVLNWTSEVAR